MVIDQDAMRHLSEAQVSVELATEDMTLNIGPQHPSTHGVLRLVARVDGERAYDVKPVVGYMHRGYEKLSEVRTYPQITALIHPQSVVHGRVEFADHSVVAQMGPPDMRGPIQYALTCPDRPAGCARQIDWTKLSRLEFSPPDAARFPAIPLAYRVIRDGGTAGATLNAANEAAVAAFLEHRIPFGRIVELVSAALDALPAAPVAGLDDVLAADAAARAFVAQKIEAPAPASR